MCNFRPNEIIDRFDKLDIKTHAKMGFNAILVDIDNTIDYPDSLNPGTKETFDFLDELEKNGFKVILFSNNTKERVERFLDGHTYSYNYWSLKPLPFAYYKVIKKFNLDINKTMSLGDQLITDCLGANFVGIYSVYTKQLVKKDIIKTKFNRVLERFIFKYILHEKV